MRPATAIAALACALLVHGQAQIDVRGLGSFNVEKRLDRNWSVTGFVAGIATYDLQELGFAFADAGLKYRLRRGITFNANYRYMLRRNLENFYDVRQTLYADLDLSQAIGRWTLTGTFRAQRLHYVKLFDAYRPPLTYVRIRAGLRCKVDYYWQPLVEVEAFQPVDHPTRRSIDQVRVLLGVGYTFNDRWKVELYEQRQQQINRPGADTYYLTAMNWYYRL